MITTPQELIRLRQRGKRPTAMVLLTLGAVLDDDEANPTIEVGDNQRIAEIDLRCLHGLEVSIITDSKRRDVNRLFDLVAAVLAIEPRYLAIVVDDMPTGWVLVESGYRVEPMRRFTLAQEIEWEAAA